MKEKIKDKWVQALLSGDYTQSAGVLRNDSGFCCLGVLCDLYIKEEKTARWTKFQENYGFNGEEEEDFEFKVVPEQVMKWAGLNSTVGLYVDVLEEDSESSLVVQNDENEASFEQIATIIQNKWEEL